MQVEFLNTISDTRTVSKNFTTIAKAECEPYGEFEIDSPVIRVRPFENFASVNMFYIPEYLRYYKRTGLKRISGNVIEIKGETDVLQTYGDVIRQCPAVCVANENIGTSYVPDKNLPVDLRKKTKAYIFSDSDFNVATADDTTNNFIINVTGGTAIEP